MKVFIGLVAALIGFTVAISYRRNSKQKEYFHFLPDQTSATRGSVF